MGNTLYQTDLHAWLMEQAQLLRNGDVASLDLGNLAEEIESLGGSQRRELSNRLKVLVMHLLKWQMQPEHRSKSWKRTVDTQRDEIEALLEQSPSMRQTVANVVERVYPKAKKQALQETELIADPFPAECPYAVGQLLDEAFFPDAG